MSNLVQHVHSCKTYAEPVCKTFFSEFFCVYLSTLALQQPVCKTSCETSWKISRDQDPAGETGWFHTTARRKTTLKDIKLEQGNAGSQATLQGPEESADRIARRTDGRTKSSVHARLSSQGDSTRLSKHTSKFKCAVLKSCIAARIKTALRQDLKNLNVLTKQKGQIFVDANCKEFQDSEIPVLCWETARML
jgi:hypothetical protein